MATEVEYYGSGHPQAGQIKATTTIPDAPDAPLDHAEQNRALVRARAADLDKKGKYLEASALRATIGA